MDKQSPIGKFFKICEDENKATCTLCSSVISRGDGSSRSFATTEMNDHMSYKHLLTPGRVQTDDKPESAESINVDTIYIGNSTGWNSTDRYDSANIKRLDRMRKKWSQSNPETQKAHKAILKMIAVNIQPHSNNDDRGFNELIGILEPRYILPGPKFFREKIIPEMHDTLRGHIQADVSEAKCLRLTTDTWTAHTMTTSFISLTTHWIYETVSYTGTPSLSKV